MTTAIVTGPARAPGAGADLALLTNRRLIFRLITAPGRAGHTSTGEIYGSTAVTTDDMGQFSLELDLNIEIDPKPVLVDGVWTGGTFYEAVASGASVMWQIRLTEAGTFEIGDPAIQVASPVPPGFVPIQGHGVNPGGTTSQALVKASNADYDTTWATVSGGGGGAVSSVNTKTGAVVLAASDVGADPAGTSAAETTRAEAAEVVNANAIGTETSRAEAAEALAIPLAQKAQPSGVATLDGTGVVPTSQIPALALVQPTVVASQAAMLALTAQPGDVAIRSDLGKTFMLGASPASTLGNWVELAATGKVTSVNGQQGVVVLGYTDVGAASTTDSRLSDARTPTAHAGTHASAGSDAVTVAESQVTGLTTDLAGKVPTSQLGAASGVATLGSDGILTAAQRPTGGGGGGGADVGALPNALDGAPPLVLWLNADDIAGVTDGGNVASWTDAASGIAVIQATAAKQPILRAAPRAFNGHAVVRFNASNAQTLVASTSQPLGPNSTICVVSMATINVGNATQLIDWRGDGYFDLYTVAGAPMFRGGSTDGMAVATNVTDRRGMILTGVGDATGDTVWRDGIALADSSSTNRPYTVTSLYIGSNADTASSYWGGDIAEVIVYSAALTAAQLHQLWRGLAVKYGWES